jgi:hypothetical protein
VVDGERFRPELDLASDGSARIKGGRAPSDAVLMCKPLVPQTLSILSDDQTEHQRRDGLSSVRFVGLVLEDPGRHRSRSLTRVGHPGVFRGVQLPPAGASLHTGRYER